MILTRSIATVLALVAMVQVAAGEKLLVLQSEGRVDARTRASIDAAIVKLARTGPDQITPGEITFSDAAALVGCNPDEATCRDEVIASLAVDAIVITSVQPKPGGLEISVRRAGKRGSSREATTTVTPDALDRLDAIAPVLGVKVATPGPVGPPAPAPVTPVTPPPPMIGPRPPAAEPAKPAPEPPAPTTNPDPVRPPAVSLVEPASPAQPLDRPAGSDDARERKRNRLRIAGMGTGGGMVLLGFILWGAAAGVGGDINDFQVRSRDDLEALRELEAKGDSYAGWGNFFFVGGLALGGVSTYYFFKARKARKRSATATTARVIPMLFDGGAGVGVTLGGMP